jgi:hypothetical protein
MAGRSVAPAGTRGGAGCGGWGLRQWQHCPGRCLHCDNCACGFGVAPVPAGQRRRAGCGGGWLERSGETGELSPSQRGIPPSRHGIRLSQRDIPRTGCRLHGIFEQKDCFKAIQTSGRHVWTRLKHVAVRHKSPARKLKFLSAQNGRGSMMALALPVFSTVTNFCRSNDILSNSTRSVG